MTRWVSLGEVVEQTQRRVPVESDAVYRNVGVLNRGRGLFEKPTLAGSVTKYPFLSQLSTDDLVYSKLFGWEGAVAVVGEEFDDAFVSSEFPTFRIDQDQMDPAYLRHVVGWEGFVEQLRAGTTGLGQRRQRVNPQTFLASHVPLPPLVDQRRIAAHLDSLASTIAVSDRRSGTDALWESMRADPPVGERTRIGDLVQEVTRPVAVDPDVIYPMCGVRWYGEGLFERERKLGSSLSAKTVFELRQGDLVYNRLFAWKQSFAIAEGRGGHVSYEFPTFRIDESAVRSEVLRYLLLTRPFTADVNVASSGTTPTSRNRLKVQDFLTLTVDVPPPAAQDRLMKTLHLLETARRAQKRKSALTAALLPAARNEIFSSIR